MKNLNNITNVQNEKLCAYPYVECHSKITVTVTDLRIIKYYLNKKENVQ